MLVSRDDYPEREGRFYEQPREIKATVEGGPLSRANFREGTTPRLLRARARARYNILNIRASPLLFTP